MSYDYKKQRNELFTEQGVKVLTAVRDEAFRLLHISGAFMAQKVLTGDSWTAHAALDYMVELGELFEVTHNDRDRWGQHRVYIGGKV